MMPDIVIPTALISSITTLFIPTVVALSTVWLGYRKLSSGLKKDFEESYRAERLAEVEDRAAFRRDMFTELEGLRGRFQDIEAKLLQCERDHIDTKSKLASVELENSRLSKLLRRHKIPGSNNGSSVSKS